LVHLACTDGYFVEDLEDAEDASRPHYGHVPMRKFDESEDKSPEQIASDLSRRYRGANPVRYTGDMNEIPQRLLMPSVHDASLWQVRVKVSALYILFFALLTSS
jgi:transcription elongation factor SPT5